MTEALLKTGKHTVTAITRIESETKIPEGVVSKKVDYSKQETLVDALRGQDALIITLSAFTPEETARQLINAAGEAGVAWILPNEWSPDTANEGLIKDLFMFPPKGKQSHHISDLMKYTLISCYCACRRNSQSNRRSWKEYLYCCIYRLLVRMESRYACSIWHRLCQPHGYFLR
jgi:hypothetical protein